MCIHIYIYIVCIHPGFRGRIRPNNRACVNGGLPKKGDKKQVCGACSVSSAK